MNTDIVPLAITMMAGPQIMSAIIFVSVKDAVRMSLAFIGGAAIGVTAGVVIAKGLASLLGINTAIGDSSDPSTLGKVIQIGLVLLLVAAAIRNFLKRATIEPPNGSARSRRRTPEDEHSRSGCCCSRSSPRTP